MYASSSDFIVFSILLEGRIVVGWDSCNSARDDSQVLAKVDIDGYRIPDHQYLP